MLFSGPLTRGILGLGLVCAALAGCDRQSDQNTQPAAIGSQPAEAAPGVDRSHRGSPLPPLTLTDAQGKPAPLAPAGKPLLVNLWATWCPPCVAELPTLDRLAAANPAVTVAIVSEDTIPPAQVGAFLAGKGIAHLAARLDPANSAITQLHLDNLPVTVLYDANGREVWRYAGGRDWTDAQSAKLLAEAGR